MIFIKDHTQCIKGIAPTIAKHGTNARFAVKFLEVGLCFTKKKTRTEQKDIALSAKQN